MKYVPVTNTDLRISRLGLGTVKFGRNQQVKYPQPFNLPTDTALVNLLACAKENGINLLDTAPAYGSSEERLGKLLKGQRHDWIIMTKAGEYFSNNESSFNFSAHHIKKSLIRSLKQLQTDYIDIVLIHSNGDDMKIITQDHVFDTLAQLKQQGIIRAYGMSTKTIAGGIACIEQADCVMATYNPLDQKEAPILAKAHELNKIVFIKKAFASGYLDTMASGNPIQYAMDFIFKHPGASSIILGTINEAHLKENIASFTQCFASL